MKIKENQEVDKKNYRSGKEEKCTIYGVWCTMYLKFKVFLFKIK